MVLLLHELKSKGVSIFLTHRLRQSWIRRAIRIQVWNTSSIKSFPGSEWVNRGIISRDCHRRTQHKYNEVAPYAVRRARDAEIQSLYDDCAGYSTCHCQLCSRNTSYNLAIAAKVEKVIMLPPMQGLPMWPLRRNSLSSNGFVVYSKVGFHKQGMLCHAHPNMPP